MTLDITKVRYAASLDTFKNVPSIQGSISVPSTSYGPVTYKSYSTTITLSETGAAANVYQNFSFDSSKYYVGNNTEIAVDVNFKVQTRISRSGTTMTVTCYVINNTTGTVSNTAFTLDAYVRQFVSPY